MRIEYDPVKNARNIALRGLSFELAGEFEWNSALIAEDRRKDYGEPRFIAVGLLHGRLHVVVFSPRGQSVRIVSLRRANGREVRRYDESKA